MLIPLLVEFVRFMHGHLVAVVVHLFQLLVGDVQFVLNAGEEFVKHRGAGGQFDAGYLVQQHQVAVGRILKETTHGFSGIGKSQDVVLAADVVEDLPFDRGELGNVAGHGALVVKDRTENVDDREFFDSFPHLDVVVEHVFRRVTVGIEAGRDQRRIDLADQFGGNFIELVGVVFQNFLKQGVGLLGIFGLLLQGDDAGAQVAEGEHLDASCGFLLLDVGQVSRNAEGDADAQQGAYEAAGEAVPPVAVHVIECFEMSFHGVGLRFVQPSRRPHRKNRNILRGGQLPAAGYGFRGDFLILHSLR